MFTNQKFIYFSRIVVLIVLFHLFRKSEEVRANTNPCDCRGIIDLSLSGGSSQYRFLWNDGVTSENRSQLCPGVYTVTITTEDGATAKKEFTILPEAGMTITAEVADVSCADGSDGVINISVSGGAAPYKFEWQDGEETEDIFALSTGSYSLTVIDQDGCAAYMKTEIKNISPLVANAITNNAGDFITLEISGGAGDYHIQWSDGNEGLVIPVPDDGNYSAIVTDKHGCTAEVSSGKQLTVSFETSGPSCLTGLTDMTVVIEGGEAPYIVKWSDGTNDLTAKNLTAGNYIVDVTDVNGKHLSKSIDINEVYQPMQLGLTSVSASCMTSEDGGIDLNIAGGIEPFTFSWSNGNISEDLLLVPAGTYAVTVTDGSGCQQTETVSIESPASLEVRLTSTENMVTADVSGGTAPYQYEWSTGSREKFSEVTGNDTAFISVTDANGCTAKVSTGKELQVMNTRR